MRVVSTRVLPEPAPASTSSGPSRAPPPRAARGSARDEQVAPVRRTDSHAGKIISNVAPRSVGTSASVPPMISPPRCAARARGRCPSRAPSCEKPGSKTRRRSSRGTPGPSSATRMRTPPSGRRVPVDDDRVRRARRAHRRRSSSAPRAPTRAAPRRPARRAARRCADVRCVTACASVGTRARK